MSFSKQHLNQGKQSSQNIKNYLIQKEVAGTGFEPATCGLPTKLVLEVPKPWF
jgi:hypothetical protein